MLLSVNERVALLGVIPPEAESIVLARVVKKLREDLGFTETELADWAIEDGMDWSKGCPRCGNEAIEYPGKEMRLSPERKCPKCGMVHSETDFICRRCRVDLLTGEPAAVSLPVSSARGPVALRVWRNSTAR